MPRFKKGQSGNPKGRPKGSTDRRTRLRALLEPHADQLIAKAVETALHGDTTALRLCIDRIVPPMPAESSPVKIKVAAGGDPTKAGEAILSHAFNGDIAPETAQKLLQAVRSQTQIAEVGELVQRIEALEARAAHEA